MSRNDEMTERRVMDRREASPAAPTVPTESFHEKLAREMREGTAVFVSSNHAPVAQPLAASAVPAALSKDAIRSIFMAHGFTVKPSETDLKQYVYDAAAALLAASPTPAATMPDGQAVTVDPQRVMQASGFGSLLSEIMGKGALHRHGDQDLIERVQRACSDNEAYLEKLFAPPAQQPASSEATMICPQCGVDRMLDPCPGMADECAMIADAHLAAQVADKPPGQQP